MGIKLGSCLDGEKGLAPGPGNYDVPGSTKKVQGGTFGVKFVTSSRRLENDLGPGQYDIPSSFDKVTRSHSAKTSRGTFGSSRTKKKPVLEVPGPGQYTIDDGASTRKSGYGFGTSQRASVGKKSKDVVPGPG
jgi:hypothetical protein